MGYISLEVDTEGSDIVKDTLHDTFHMYVNFSIPGKLNALDQFLDTKIIYWSIRYSNMQKYIPFLYITIAMRTLSMVSFWVNMVILWETVVLKDLVLEKSGNNLQDLELFEGLNWRLAWGETNHENFNQRDIIRNKIHDIML